MFQAFYAFCIAHYDSNFRIQYIKMAMTHKLEEKKKLYGKGFHILDLNRKTDILDLTREKGDFVLD